MKIKETNINSARVLPIRSSMKALKGRAFKARRK
jgi:hypothetical protein